MKAKNVTTLDGSTFLIATTTGDVHGEAGDVTGFFYKDMRHLSKWELLVNGATPQVLSCDDTEYYFSQHFLAPRTGTIYENPDLSIVRRRLLGEGFTESLEVSNHSSHEKQVDLEIRFDSDFSDLFEVKDALSKKGRTYQEARDDDWVLGYQREAFKRETVIRCSFAREISPGVLKCSLQLPAKSRKNLVIQVIPVVEGNEAELKYLSTSSEAKPNLRLGFKEWITSAPRIDSSVSAIVRLYRRSLIDLAALRFYPDPKNLPDASVPAAGLPWFMAMFGRDSLITSYQALPFAPELAETTLKALAKMQGTKVDAFRDEEPGKILHELRFGELTVFKERPQSPYFGAADSTPLFLILLDEYERWSGDRTLVSALESNARRALEWIDRYGDRDGDGFVEYQRGMDTGLENQCWKDSWNSILFSNGTVAQAPRATCEIQGYVYDAKVRCARLAREVWNDPALSVDLLKQAEALKEKFNRSYWIEEKGYYALALDRDKAQVDSLSSNIGHLLWSGIVPHDRANRIAELLMSPRMFSGWGIRTMGTADSGYNPIEYHNGTVWPHDTSIIAHGLARYGFREQASQLCWALFAIGPFFDYRLPEVFAGYDRDETEFPVEYPTASSPQAWATGAPLLAFRVILGLEAENGALRSAPVLPKQLAWLHVNGIIGPHGRQDFEAKNENAESKEQLVWDWFERRDQTMRRKQAS